MKNIKKLILTSTLMLSSTAFLGAMGNQTTLKSNTNSPAQEVNTNQIQQTDSDVSDSESSDEGKLDAELGAIIAGVAANLGVSYEQAGGLLDFMQANHLTVEQIKKEEQKKS
jgi:hypothetical protein